MSKKTLALIIGLIVLTGILLAIALEPLFRGTKEQTQPSEVTEGQLTLTPTPPAHTILNLTPNPLTLAASGTGTVEVVVDSQQNELTAIQLEIGFDPQMITNVQIIPGDFFPNPVTLLNNVDQENGRVTYALGITPAQTPIQGQGVVARMTFQRAPTATAGETAIELLPKTLVTQQGIGPSVLKSTAGTTVIIPQVTQVTPPPITTTEPPPPDQPTQ